MGNVLPSDGSPALATTQTWRVVFGVPIVLSAFQLLVFTFIYRSETIKFNIVKGNKEEALSTIQKAYALQDG